MCLGVPLKILKIINNEIAIAGLSEETNLEINISLTPEVKEGDYVIVHAGFAISILENQDALDILNILENINNDNIN
ncbi:MAG: HypC/HybG/HupF family hydrogenase formation chaperone [bacterium]|jgi:hydrogenase expression/formation protein HypC